MQSSFLTPHDLADRWNTTPHTLSQWRWNGRGPHFFKIGRRVLYKFEDIECFEENKRCQNTSQASLGNNFTQLPTLPKKRGS